MSGAPERSTLDQRALQSAGGVISVLETAAASVSASRAAHSTSTKMCRDAALRRIVVCHLHPVEPQTLLGKRRDRVRVSEHQTAGGARRRLPAREIVTSVDPRPYTPHSQ